MCVYVANLVFVYTEMGVFKQMAFLAGLPQWKTSATCFLRDPLLIPHWPRLGSGAPPMKFCVEPKISMREFHSAYFRSVNNEETLCLLKM